MNVGIKIKPVFFRNCFFVFLLLFFSYCSWAGNMMAQGFSYNEENAEKSTKKAIKMLRNNLQEEKPDLLFLTCTNDYSDSVEVIVKTVNREFPDVPVWGMDTIKGFYMNSEIEGSSIEIFNRFSVGLLAFTSDDHEFVVRGAEVKEGENHAQATERILSEIEGKRVPEMILLGQVTHQQAPQVLEVLNKRYGKDVKIFGALAFAPEFGNVLGRIISNSDVYERKGISLLFIYTDKKIGHNFQTGFRALDKKGIVTEMDGIKIMKIDDKPALEVYVEWTDGVFREKIKTTAPNDMFYEMMVYPLARVYTCSKGTLKVSTLVGPSPEDGGLWAFTDVKVGDQLQLLRVSEKALIIRPYLSTLKARKLLKGKYCGGISFYCDGAHRMLRKAGKEVELGQKFQSGFRKKPYMAVLVAGEYGCSEASNMSYFANMMQSTIVFGE